MKRQSHGQKLTCAFGRGTTIKGRKVRCKECRASFPAVLSDLGGGVIVTQGQRLGEDTHSPYPQDPSWHSASFPAHCPRYAHCI